MPVPYGPASAWVAIGFVALSATIGRAQVTVTLPDTSQTTALTVNISEQATVTLPSTVTFNVTNVTVGTLSSAATVRVEGVVRSAAMTQIRLSLRANTGTFTPPATGATTWSAADVSWSGITWTGATGASGILDSTSFTPLALCGTAGCSTTALVFTLAPKSAVRRAGQHRLVVTWKIESVY